MSPDAIASLVLGLVSLAVKAAAALGGSDPHATVRDALAEVEHADKGAVAPRASEITKRHLERVRTKP